MPYLRAFGHHLPTRIVTNADLEIRTGRVPASIEKTSGILERRYAAENETVADLGLAAANACLANANLIANEIGLILFSSGSAERAFPGPASVLAQKLGLTTTPAIDIPVASAGSLIAIAFAADLAPRYNNILVVASEIMSRRIADTDPDTAILFGDGAGAAIVSNEASPNGLRIVDVSLSTDGNYADALQLPYGGAIQMKGLDVIIQASRKIPRSIQDLLEKNNLKPSDISLFLMHQANVNLIRKVATALEVPEDRFFRNIDRYGNTSSASLLIAASEWRAANPNPPATPVILAVFGAGFNWGSVLLTP
ncbi:MAG: ketoacyl-ACP synthase III [Edaphobacter sp.]